ncbi:MAG: hypothetical protein WCD63_15905, partial [Terrimicrobiaceae bacterium]
SRTSALTLVSRSAANRRAARHVFSSIVKFTVFTLKQSIFVSLQFKELRPSVPKHGKLDSKSAGPLATHGTVEVYSERASRHGE